MPYTFVITVDGVEVYSAPVGGPKDHEIQGADLAAAQPIIDKRMTGRVRVTAGPHDVGFTWKERPFQLQDVWEPSRRDSQEVHMVAGLPKLRTVSIDGPYNVRGIAEGPSRERLFCLSSRGEELRRYHLRHEDPDQSGAACISGVPSPQPDLKRSAYVVL